MVMKEGLRTNVLICGAGSSSLLPENGSVVLGDVMSISEMVTSYVFVGCGVKDTAGRSSSSGEGSSPGTILFVFRPVERFNEPMS